MKINLLVLFSLILSLVSCDETTGNRSKYKSNFSGEFIKKKKGLKVLLSDYFTLSNIKTDNSKSFKVGFNLDSGINFLLHPHNGDTIDQFVLLKNKKLHYLVRGDYPNEYSIQAIRIKGDTIFGWDNNVRQMSMIDDRVETNAITMDSLDNKYSLAADRKAVYSIYSQFIENEEAIYVIKKLGKDSAPEKDEKSDVQVMDDLEVEKELFISNVYPNPANEKLNVEFQNIGTYNLEIVGTSGASFYKNQLAGQKISIDVSSIPEGIHILIVTDTDGNVLDSKKVVVDR